MFAPRVAAPLRTVGRMQSNVSSLDYHVPSLFFLILRAQGNSTGRRQTSLHRKAKDASSIEW